MQTINRRLDLRGRIHLPLQFREKLNMEKDEEISITLQNDAILLKPSKPKCVFCGKPTNYTFYNANICKECVVKIKEL